MNTATADTLSDDLYHSLLLDYATGRLGEAKNLIIATHISMSRNARRYLEHYESLGGHVLEQDCAPISLSDSALDSILEKIDTLESENTDPQTAVFPGDLNVPAPLQECLGAQRRPLNWKFMYPGFKTFKVDLDCKEAHTRFLKVAPAKRTPHHTHGGLEITLILDGAYEDEFGRYRRGDLIIRDENHTHSPQSCPQNGCVCMVVSDTPIKFTGLSKLLNFFVRI